MRRLAKLFGTDGIRGQVGKYPLTPEAVFTVGRTLGLWLKEQYPQQKRPLKVLIGRDTRDSGGELESALLKGTQSEGLDVLRLGVCPTPCVAYLTRVLRAHLGVSISASHNPCTDNGIKFFDADGYKLFSFAERRIEEIFFNFSTGDTAPEFKLEDLTGELDWFPLYLDFAKNTIGELDISPLRIVIDCAYGSFSKIAPKIFRGLGVDVFVINNEPNGKNINVNCGTLYPQTMAKKILEYQADLGIAFDGDGDRVIVADEKGNILDGDRILAILCEHFLQQRKLTNNSLICTQMSNIGLELWLQRQGMQMIRTPVGDKYVLQEMLKHKANLGGEQSGHIIILERTTTGDGLIVGLELIKAMLETKKQLSKLANDLQKFPQILLNVEVKEKRPLEEVPGLNDTVNRCQTELGKAGRILVRYSGTENLARIMVEGNESSLVSRLANSVAKVIQDAQGRDT